jgi:hypothetical protein
MAERFYPKGYMGSEDAILLIAKTRDPSRWTHDRVSPDERAVWEGLGKTLNAQLISGHLTLLKREGQPPDLSMIDRYCDFREATDELRKSLFAGETGAYFINENGELDFIRKDGWSDDQATDILLAGVVDLEGCWRRLLLLKAAEIEKLAKALPPAWAGDNAKPPKTLAEKMRFAEKREAFDSYRKSLGGEIPTLAADITAMKKLGISRHDARRLRKDHPRRPLGRPAAKPKIK